VEAFRTTVRLIAVFGGSGVATFPVVAVAVLARVVRVGAGAGAAVAAGFDLADALVVAVGFVDMLRGVDELEMSWQKTRYSIKSHDGVTAHRGRVAATGQDAFGATER